jgi:hypothetical protein
MVKGRGLKDMLTANLADRRLHLTRYRESYRSQSIDRYLMEFVRRFQCLQAHDPYRKPRRLTLRSMTG